MRFWWNDEVPHLTAIVHGFETIDQGATLKRHPANVGFDLRIGLKALHRHWEGQADDIAAPPLSLEMGIAADWLERHEWLVVQLQARGSLHQAGQPHVQGKLRFPFRLDRELDLAVPRIVRGLFEQDFAPFTVIVARLPIN